MANSQRGEVRLDVGGKVYTLALDLNAMCELEDLLSTPDKPVTFQDVARGLMATRMGYIRAFFWACFRRHHPDITLVGVSDLMQEAGGLAPFLEKVNALMEMTRPDKGDEAAAVPSRPTRVASPKKSGTGPASIGKVEKLA